MTTPSGDLLRPPSPFMENSFVAAVPDASKPDFLEMQKIIFQAARGLPLARQTEFSRQRMAGAALRRAKCSDQPRNGGGGCECAGVSLVQSAGSVFRATPQRGLIEGEQLAVIKQDAPADHDGVDRGGVLAEHHLRERPAQ